jgi:hypothetical protein
MEKFGGNHAIHPNRPNASSHKQRDLEELSMYLRHTLVTLLPIHRCKAASAVARIFIMMISIAAVTTLVLPAHASKRIGVVIGNESYATEKPLANPINDASLIARTLRNDLRFDEVIERRNLNRKEMIDLLDEISQKARAPGGIDTVVIYYSGHGMQGPGGSYLLPVDADIRELSQVRRDGVLAQEWVDMLRDTNARLGLLILDACRNNPFQTRVKSATKGLSRPTDVSGNLLVAYATREGDYADDGSGANSPYAVALAANLRLAARPVLEIFDDVSDAVRRQTGNRQQPTRYGDLPVRVRLLPGATRLNTPNPVDSVASPVVQPVPFTLSDAMSGKVGVPNVVSLEFRMTDSGWISVEDGAGKAILSGQYKAGQRAAVSHVLPLKILIGNAAATSFGIDVPTAGLKVAEVDFSGYTNSSGIAILSLNTFNEILHIEAQAGFCLSFGAFATEKEADQLVKRIVQSGVTTNASIVPMPVKGKSIYAVRARGFNSAAQAEAASERLKTNGIEAKIGKCSK